MFVIELHYVRDKLASVNGTHLSVGKSMDGEVKSKKSKEEDDMDMITMSRGMLATFSCLP